MYKAYMREYMKSRRQKQREIMVGTPKLPVNLDANNLMQTEDARTTETIQRVLVHQHRFLGVLGQLVATIAWRVRRRHTFDRAMAEFRDKAAAAKVRGLGRPMRALRTGRKIGAQRKTARRARAIAHALTAKVHREKTHESCPDCLTRD
jgi:hypothetical protein